MSWSHYLLQVNIYLIVFYGFYRLLLAKETYFILNRIYLICSGIFSLAIPFMQIDWFSQQQISKQIYVQVDQLNQFIVQANPEALEQKLNWGNVVVMIYLLGVAFFLIRFTVQLLAVKKMFDGIKSGLAFSFWRKKVVAHNLPEVAIVNHHEDIHIKQLHTFDVIFFELLGIITWFNPIIYLYKETVKSIHEFLADEAAAKFQGDKDAYSMLLLNQAFGVNVNTLTNGFFKKSMIKKRIFMLYKERSRKTAIVKYGIFVPLLAAALLLSSATIRKNEQILAVAEQVQIEGAKDVVRETLSEKLNLSEEKAIEVTISEPQVKFATSKVQGNDRIESFYKYLANNIKYPSTAADNHVQGNLIVSFTVANRKLENIVVAPKLGYGADEETSLTLAKYNGSALADGKYSMRVEYRMTGAFTKVLNENVVTKKGHTALNTITIMGFTKSDDENRVYSFASIENPPSYPGGMTKFYEFLAETIKFPEEAKAAEIQGKVYISFVVDKDGSIADTKVERKLGYGTDEEAVRVVKLSKPWNPGLINGKPVRVKFSLPISFNLNKKSSEQKIYGMVPSDQVSPGSFFAKEAEYLEKAPLVILDGKQYDGKMSEINPNKIESISILKDLNSVALYGDKGKNGVILITTKKDKTVVIEPKN